MQRRRKVTQSKAYCRAICEADMIMQASLLVVDDRLLRQIATDALGDDANGTEESSLTAYLLSFWLSGAFLCLPENVINNQRQCERLLFGKPKARQGLGWLGFHSAPCS